MFLAPSPVFPLISPGISDVTQLNKGVERGDFASRKHYGKREREIDEEREKRQFEQRIGISREDETSRISGKG